MQNSIKGALAAVVGGTLLVGGAGTLAYWNDTEAVPGTGINSGKLGLVVDGENEGCGGWVLDGGTPFDGATMDLVPGDELTKTCEFTIVAEGEHLDATLAVSAPSLSVDAASVGAPGNTLGAVVGDVLVGGQAATAFDETDNGKTLTASVTVTFDGSADNSTQDFRAALADLTLTATQQHA